MFFVTLFFLFMNEIRIETKYTVEDYFRTEIFLENLRLKSSRIIKFGNRFLSIFALIQIFFAFIMLNDGKVGIAIFAFFSSLLIFFLVYKFIPSYYNSPSLSLFKARLKSVEPDSILFSERRIVFSEEGVSETHKFGNYLTNWEAISKVIESDEDFFFYLHNTIRFQPKRDIPDEQIDLVRILIKANLKEKAEFRYLAID